jgi:hypothetical protein
MGSHWTHDVLCGPMGARIVHHHLARLVSDARTRMHHNPINTDKFGEQGAGVAISWTVEGGMKCVKFADGGEEETLERTCQRLQPLDAADNSWE